VNVGGSASESVASDKKITVGKKMSLTVSDDLLETIKKHRKAEIGESLQIHCGEVQITIKKDGTISVEGKDVNVKATGTIKVQADKLQVKTDGKVDLKAGGDVVVKGGAVKLN
jgi:type VI secretion system secreted protein VgrG